MASSKISLKLLIDKKAKKVLFAEAGKEFVDFVFSLLTLPIGVVAKLVSAGTMHGSVGQLYQSVERMGASYLQPGTGRSDLLRPKLLQTKVPVHGGRALLQELLMASRHQARLKLYTCPGSCVTMTMDAGRDCPQCKQPMAEEMAYVPPSSSWPAAPPNKAGDGGGAASAASYESGGGYVKGLVTYMVTDGLEVTPMSAISSITLINKFSSGKQDVELAEKYVTVGMKEGLALLKAVLRSDTVLSDVFLATNKSK